MSIMSSVLPGNNVRSSSCKGFPRGPISALFQKIYVKVVSALRRNTESGSEEKTVQSFRERYAVTESKKDELGKLEGLFKKNSETLVMNWDVQDQVEYFDILDTMGGHFTNEIEAFRVRDFISDRPSGKELLAFLDR